MKNLLRLAQFIAVCFGVVAVGRSAPAQGKRPNIVFIFSDDHAYQAISAYGDERKLVQTPNIDRIARGGMRFDRCLVTNSICGPSRATVLTGTYNHINGFVNNSLGTRFDGSQVTFPKLLRAAGYQTAIVGKWHLVSDPTGFDFWQVLPGQGVYYNPPMVRNGERIETKGYVTDITTDVSLDWLDRRDPSKPFLLMCQHKAPHRQWLPAIRHLSADADRIYPEPATLFDDYAGRGPAERNQDMSIAKTMDAVDLKLTRPPNVPTELVAAWDAYYEPRNVQMRAANPQGADLVRWKYQRYMHDYLATIRGVDESVGRVLDYLERHGLAENTIVVYSSDQGFFLGEHGWFDKRWIFEESLRMPLLVRWPGVTAPGSVNRDLVSNVDFAETLLEAVGEAVPAHMQGRSFVSLLRGQRPADWRTAFYYQYFEFPQPHRVQPHYGVVTDRYKLVHFEGPDKPAPELFDLEKDPRELRSVYEEVAYREVRENLTEELSRLRAQLKVPDPTPTEWFGRAKPKAAAPAASAH
jgi:arylsulfatase A-like enzyme